jgi:hypothetical protein
MEPRGDLSSTRYVLAHPGQEYLVLQPDATAEPFDVTLAAGTYAAQWHSVDSRQRVGSEEVTAEAATTVGFSPPFAAAGPAVLSLKRAGR